MCPQWPCASEETVSLWPRLSTWNLPDGNSSLGGLKARMAMAEWEVGMVCVSVTALLSVVSPDTIQGIWLNLIHDGLSF